MGKLRILQLCDYMQLGGAESHIITLSKGLIDKGHIVQIASSLGPAVSKLSECGIKFHELNFYNPQNYFINAEKLLNIIVEENIDIVHVHPSQSQIAISLTRLIKIVPVITTIHGAYKTPSIEGLEEFFNGFVFVSEETKKFHLDNQFVNKKLNMVIPNSVPFRTNEEEKLIPNMHALKIIYVSRLAEDKFPSIVYFINCIEQIIKFLNVEITIIGQGSKYNEVLELANVINYKLDKKVINVINGSVDVIDFMKKADVVVGVGRVILEALSVKKIPICIGNKNYVGIINKYNLLEVAKVNFTDRNSSRNLSPEFLINDLIKIQNEPEQVLSELNETVLLSKSYFEIGISAEKHQEFYREVIKTFTRKNFTLKDILKYKRKLRVLDVVRAAYDLKLNGCTYTLDNAKDTRVLIIPDISDENDKWITVLLELIKNKSFEDKITIIIRIQNQFHSIMDEVIQKIQKVLELFEAKYKIDILVDCEYHDEVNEVLFLSEISCFVPTNNNQNNTIFLCRLLGGKIVNSCEIPELARTGVIV